MTLNFGKYYGCDVKDVSSKYLVTVIEGFDRITEEQRRGCVQELFRRYEEYYQPPPVEEPKPRQRDVTLNRKLKDATRYLLEKYHKNPGKVALIVELKQLIAL